MIWAEEALWERWKKMFALPKQYVHITTPTFSNLFHDHYGTDPDIPVAARYATWHVVHDRNRRLKIQ